MLGFISSSKQQQAEADKAWSNPWRQVTAWHVLGFISSSKQQQADADEPWSNTKRHKSVSW